MFKNLPKRTKVVAGLFAVVLALVIGGGVWAGVTGKIKSSATTIPDKGTLQGTVVCGNTNSKCDLTNVTVHLQNPTIPSQHYTDDAVPGGSPASYATYSFTQVPLNVTFNVWAEGTCKNFNYGYCNSLKYSVRFTYDGQVTNKYLNIYVKKGLLHVSVFSRTDCGAPIGSPGSSCSRDSCSNCSGKYCDCYFSSGAVVTLTGADNQSRRLTLGEYEGWFDVKVGTINITVSYDGYNSATTSFLNSGCAQFNKKLVLTPQ